MIEYNKFELDNGLKVIFHKDKQTPVAAVNVVYNVGAKDEDPKKTGYAHFLEHLMFEGSQHIERFDLPLEKVGGTNNAYTDNDITNYHILLPKNNIETALWLESDRMINLAFDKNNFATQKSVVLEELKQTQSDELYGDDMKLIRQMVFKKHPYRWSTIGKKSHVENATIDDMKDFYATHYAPNNAVLSIGGDFELEYIKEIVHKWFDNVPVKNVKKRNLPTEPEQRKRRERTVYRNVPIDAIYMAFRYYDSSFKDYYTFDLITDILDDGRSSRFYQNLVKNKKIFSEVAAYVIGSHEQGMVVFTGRPEENISVYEAEKYLWEEIDKLKNVLVDKKDIEKTINAIEFGFEYIKTRIDSKVDILATCETIQDASLVNRQEEIYSAITPEIIKDAANRVLDKNKVSVLYYLAKETN